MARVIFTLFIPDLPCVDVNIGNTDVGLHMQNTVFLEN